MSDAAASGTWPTRENDPQRVAILAAADRLLAGAPRRSTGNLSVVQLAIEAELKYWVVAQRHTDLRDHFQQLAAAARHTAAASGKTTDNQEALSVERDQLRRHCDGLEQIVHTYATIINELTLENQALRDQLSQPGSNVTAPRPRQRAPMSGHRDMRNAPTRHQDPKRQSTVDIALPAPGSEPPLGALHGNGRPRYGD